MDFRNLRDTSVNIGKDKKSCECPSKNIGYIPFAVVTMTTAKGMKPTFSGKYTQRPNISDFTEYSRNFVEVHNDIAQSILKSI